MCGSMVDIQSATAENRRGKKKESRINRGKIVCPHLLRRAAIIIDPEFCLFVRTKLSKIASIA